jgi:hypothetical protein
VLRRALCFSSAETRAAADLNHSRRPWITITKKNGMEWGEKERAGLEIEFGRYR